MPKPTKAHESQNAIWVDTILATSTGAGLVEVTHQDTCLQLTPAQAISLATSLYEAAEGARGEETLLSYIEELKGQPLTTQEKSVLIRELRLHRVRQERNSHNNEPH